MNNFLFGSLIVLAIFYNVTAKDNFKGVLWSIDTLIMKNIPKVKFTKVYDAMEYAQHQFVRYFDFKNYLITDTLFDVSAKEILKEKPEKFRILFEKNKFYCWYPETKQYFVSSYKEKKDSITLNIFTGESRIISAKLTGENEKLVMDFNLENDIFKNVFTFILSPMPSGEGTMSPKELIRNFHKVNSTIFIHPIHKDL